MNYTKSNIDNQLQIENPQEGVLYTPTILTRFFNDETVVTTNEKGKETIIYKGHVTLPDEERHCSCGCEMHINNTHTATLKSVPSGSSYIVIEVEYVQLYCPNCGNTKMQTIPFKADNHFITTTVKNYICDLLATCDYTNKEVASLTGVNRNIVKAIDKERLLNKYTVETEDGKRTLFKPECQAKFLAIDEFLLHKGNKYATHIIDLETGHILWIAVGKKKQVVYDFIEHVGLEYMKGVVAVACDMNSDFEEAFKEKCSHIAIVYDHFHIVKHLNETISNIRKKEQARLEEAGDKKGAQSLKRSKYILMSSLKNLLRKDEEASNGKVISKGSKLFKEPEVVRKGNNKEIYNYFIDNNLVFFVCALVKESISLAYDCTDEKEMEDLILEAMLFCEQSENEDLIKFAKMIYNHLDGIITHATYHISSGKIEGINNKIKTVRRHAYGYPDDEYFFLKVIDMTRYSRKN